MFSSAPILKPQTFFLQELHQKERIQQIPVDLGILGHSVPSYPPPCLDSIPVTSGDCRVSCTGLCADVTQEIENRNDEKIGILAEGGTVNTIKSFFTALVKYDSYNFKSELGRFIQSNTTSNIRKMMEAYKAYKANYLRNMVFDPSTPGLSMCLY